MKNLILIPLILAIAGCSSVGNSFQKAGNGLVDAGATVAISAWAIPPLMIVTVPVAVVIGLPLLGAGSALYGVGTAMGGELYPSYFMQ